MSEKAEKVKVQRSRKRIYETFPDEAPQEAALEPAVVPDMTVEAAVAVATEPAKEPAKEPAREPAIRVAAASVFAAGQYEPVVQEETVDPFRDAMSVVHTWSALSAATGLIPLPFVDTAGFMTMQLVMLKKLSRLYGIPFDTQRSKSAITILASGVNTAYLAVSSAKLFPALGVFSLAAMPAVNGAISYAVGRVFIQHFASGGTFLDFDPVKVKGYFEEQYREGKLNGPNGARKLSA